METHHVHVYKMMGGVVGIRDATTGKLWGRWIGTTEKFIRTGHSLFALMAGWFGG